MPIDPTWEPPRLTERKRSHLWIWIVILIIAIGLVYYYFSQPKAAPVVQQQTVQETQPASNQTAATPAFVSQAPAFDSKCSVVAGIVSGSITRAGDIISFTFKNNGKETIEGSYFEASNENNKVYRQNTESLAPGSEATYTVDLGSISTDLGIKVNSFVIYPVQNAKACVNQRMIVISQ